MIPNVIDEGYGYYTEKSGKMYQFNDYDLGINQEKSKKNTNHQRLFLF
jgi:hypothetical protein